MKTRLSTKFIAAPLLLLGLAMGLLGGPSPAPTAAPRTFLPDSPAGSFTLGTQFSDHLSGLYLDSITGLWSPVKRDSFLFLDSRYHFEDNGQTITNLGLGYRKLFPQQKIILGANAFWDHIHSEHHNDFNQLGLGVEVLTEWVDARFNYYRPEDGRTQVGHSTSHSRTHTTHFGNTTTSTTERIGSTIFEAGLEGFNTEVGVKLPFLDRYAETRVYLGYYRYENPFGRDFDGFKARLEARLLQGVTANLEYWENTALMGGHWTAEIAVSVPFNLDNLITGRNPFAGASDSFKRLPRSFESRMSDRLERSHRIQTTTSSPIVTSHSLSVKTTRQVTTHTVPKAKALAAGFPVE